MNDIWEGGWIYSHLGMLFVELVNEVQRMLKKLGQEEFVFSSNAHAHFLESSSGPHRALLAHHVCFTTSLTGRPGVLFKDETW